MIFSPLLKSYRFVHSIWFVIIVFIAFNQYQSPSPQPQQSAIISQPPSMAKNQSVPAQHQVDPHAAKLVEQTVQVTVLDAKTAETQARIDQEKQRQVQEIEKFHQKLKDVQLHYVAVNQSNAREYSFSEQKLRFDQCHAQQATLTTEREQYCQDYAFNTLKKDTSDVVTVRIKNKAPLALVLSSNKKVHWIITGYMEHLKMVYVTGNHGAELSGRFNPKTERYSSFNKDLSCTGCIKSSLDSFYYPRKNLDLENTLAERFLKFASSIQTAQKGKEFLIE